MLGNAPLSSGSRRGSRRGRHHFARADESKTCPPLEGQRRTGVNAASKIFVSLDHRGPRDVRDPPAPRRPVSISSRCLSFDAALSVVRSAARFRAGGDRPCRTSATSRCCQAYGVPDAPTLGPAFIVLKRLKEAFWIAVGFALLARKRLTRADLAALRGLPRREAERARRMRSAPTPRSSVVQRRSRAAIRPACAMARRLRDRLDLASSRRTVNGASAAPASAPASRPSAVQ